VNGLRTITQLNNFHCRRLVSMCSMVPHKNFGPG